MPDGQKCSQERPFRHQDTRARRQRKEAREIAEHKERKKEIPEPGKARDSPIRDHAFQGSMRPVSLRDAAKADPASDHSPQREGYKEQVKKKQVQGQAQKQIKVDVQYQPLTPGNADIQSGQQMVHVSASSETDASTRIEQSPSVNMDAAGQTEQTDPSASGTDTADRSSYTERYMSNNDPAPLETGWNAGARSTQRKDLLLSDIHGAEGEAPQRSAAAASTVRTQSLRMAGRLKNDPAGADDSPFDKGEITRKRKRAQLTEAQKKSGRLQFETPKEKAGRLQFDRPDAEALAAAASMTKDALRQTQGSLISGPDDEDNAALDIAHRTEHLAEQSAQNGFHFAAQNAAAARRSSQQERMLHMEAIHGKEETILRSGRLRFGPMPSAQEESTGYGQASLHRHGQAPFHRQGQPIRKGQIRQGRTRGFTRRERRILKKRQQKAYYRKRYQDALRWGLQKKSPITAFFSDPAGYLATRRQQRRLLRKQMKVFQPGRNPLLYVLVILLVLMIGIASMQSCTLMALEPLTTITVTTWPAGDKDITKAEVYYTKLEAQLQQEIDRTQDANRDYDEYNFNIGEIGHDPNVLISFLSAKYGGFRFRQIKSVLDDLFALQYHLGTEQYRETRTETRTIMAGESLGTVVTSGYCNCAICCGIWAGGPTASGVYPTADHTLAVDAHDPFVPMGTEIIMDGKLYKVEDTGNFARYGVDFDVYFSDHATASNWGHRSFEAYLAGGDENEVEVTTTEEVSCYNVSLDSVDLAEVVAGILTDEEKELYEIYIASRGNRVFFASPFACDWHFNQIGTYGYRAAGTNVRMYDELEVLLPQGTKILSVLDGDVLSANGNTVVLENADGYQISFSGCERIRVGRGGSVKTGDQIASVSSQGRVRISLSYAGIPLDPYFYLDVGEGNVYAGISGEMTVKAAALIQEATKYLGVPYVWGGYSPSGFDCSGFVSYSINHCNAGWDYGRLTAEGLRGVCTAIPASAAQPGDLIFFQGTYNTSGASHVGIYLGEGKMIHAGKPVQISSCQSTYWQSHLLGFGRLP